MSALDSSLLLALTEPQPRLPSLESWLRNEVWNDAAFERAGRSPKDYLLAGERLVNERESLLATTAPQVYSELTTSPVPDRSISSFFADNPRSAAVIFDGCSLREVPRLTELARASRRAVVEQGCGRAAVPSETIQFVADRLGLGLPALGPSQLTSRQELRMRNVRYFYFAQANSYHTIGRHAGQRRVYWRA